MKMKAPIDEGEVPMSLFRLDASIRGAQSVSRQVADTAESAWLRVNPDGLVVRRNLAETPVPADAWPLAVAGSWTHLHVSMLWMPKKPYSPPDWQ